MMRMLVVATGLIFLMTGVCVADDVSGSKPTPVPYKSGTETDVTQPTQETEKPRPPQRANVPHTLKKKSVAKPHPPMRSHTTTAPR